VLTANLISSRQANAEKTYVVTRKLSDCCTGSSYVYVEPNARPAKVWQGFMQQQEQPNSPARSRSGVQAATPDIMKACLAWWLLLCKVQAQDAHTSISSCQV